MKVKVIMVSSEGAGPPYMVFRELDKATSADVDELLDAVLCVTENVEVEIYVRPSQWRDE